MEGRWSQTPTGRRTSNAIHHKINAEKMVQNTNGTGVDSEMAQRNQGLSNIQTHAYAHQEGTSAPRGAN